LSWTRARPGAQPCKTIDQVTGDDPKVTAWLQANAIAIHDCSIGMGGRSILFEADVDNVQALRFHDLRATVCTWARREGKSDSWISERTGQEVTGCTQRPRRSKRQSANP
jgi:hypothetical protein